jgi:hypothetical protein
MAPGRAPPASQTPWTQHSADWDPPREQQASEIKIRARDAAKPEIAETATVTITTMPKI